MTKIKSAFTYRDPEVTVEYPAGWEGPMPKKHEKAARDAGAIEEEEGGDDISTHAPSPPRRTRRTED